MDNRHGTAQSVIDGLLRASGVLLAGKTVVVAGFGACGAGIAESARALGARVVITEVDPVRALDAVLRGFLVLPLADAAPIGEVFITATGSADVITGRAPGGDAGRRHPRQRRPLRRGDRRAGPGRRWRSGCSPTSARTPTPTSCADGRRLLLLAEGRVVNLVAADGHPPEVMDLAFGIEALTLAWLAGSAERLPADVHPVPSDIDAEAARMVLAALGTRTDSLTPAQRSYLASWRTGS